MSAWLRSHPYTGLLLMAVILTGLGCAFIRPWTYAIYWGFGVLAGGGWIARWTEAPDED